MAFTSGSVSTFGGASGLLQTLLDFVTGDSLTEGRDWTIIRNSNTTAYQSLEWNKISEPFGSDCKEVILRNTGLNDDEEVLVGIREWKYVSEGAYGLDFTFYLTQPDPADPWWVSKYLHKVTGYDYNWNRWSGYPMLPLLDGEMNYWFYSNKQRIIIVVEVSSNYESAYIGFGNRYGSKENYQFPYAILGSLHTNNNYTFVDDTEPKAHQFIIGCDYGKWIVTPDNRCIGNAWLLPHNDFSDSGTVGRTTNSSYLITPCYVVHSDNTSLLMQLDGVYHVQGDSLQSEDDVSFDSETLDIFQNVYRNDYFQFMGVVR